MYTKDDIIQNPGKHWVERLRKGNYIWLVKENKVAEVFYPYDPSGEIAIRNPDLQIWFVDLNGKGLDGKPLMAPLQGNLSDNPTPLQDSEIKKLQRKVKCLEETVRELESYVPFYYPHRDTDNEIFRKLALAKKSLINPEQWGEEYKAIKVPDFDLLPPGTIYSAVEPTYIGKFPIRQELNIIKDPKAKSAGEEEFEEFGSIALRYPISILSHDANIIDDVGCLEKHMTVLIRSKKGGFYTTQIRKNNFGFFVVCENKRHKLSYCYDRKCWVIRYLPE